MPKSLTFSFFFSLLFANVHGFPFSREQTFGTEQHPDHCQWRFPPPETSSVPVSCNILKLYYRLACISLRLYLAKESKFCLIQSQVRLLFADFTFLHLTWNEFECVLMYLHRSVDMIQTGICPRTPLAGSNRMDSKDWETSSDCFWTTTRSTILH